MHSLGTVDTIRPINAAPPNLRDAMCGPHRKRPATEDENDVLAANASSDSPYAVTSKFNSQSNDLLTTPPRD